MARQGDRVRLRIGNLTMTNHPIHLHGHDFEVTCTDGGWVPKSARWPEVTNLWEFDSWDAMAASYGFEANAPGMQDAARGRAHGDVPDWRRDAQPTQ